MDSDSWIALKSSTRNLLWLWNRVGSDTTCSNHEHSVAMGIVALVAFSIPTSSAMVLLLLAEMVKGIADGFAASNWMATLRITSGAVIDPIVYRC
ncbi:hypothetical protein CDL15_Pgr004481 [Punica granatum]|uniref:Uncharacterized protein n=1 Tax=Punica granatum TaxID=22663 RepID=A0A218WBT9_PUNGR|nr:hypothetical protein CDL15_Pgr004481 [Punica granatum]